MYVTVLTGTTLHTCQPNISSCVIDITKQRFEPEHVRRAIVQAMAVCSAHAVLKCTFSCFVACVLRAVHSPQVLWLIVRANPSRSAPYVFDDQPSIHQPAGASRLLPGDYRGKPGASGELLIGRVASRCNSDDIMSLCPAYCICATIRESHLDATRPIRSSPEAPGLPR